MNILELEIENFRGIKSAKINFPRDSKMLCIIGPGDSTKSTILKALEWLTWPTYNIKITDADFYEGNTRSDIVIRGTFVGINDEFMGEDKYGLMLRRPGVIYDRVSDDEPAENDMQCLSVQLTINDSLEPRWEVVCNRLEPKAFGVRDRQKMGVSIIGQSVAKDMSWGSNSVLQKYISSKDVFRDSYTKAMRNAIGGVTLPELDKSTATIPEIVARYGVVLHNDLYNRMLFHNGSSSSEVILSDSFAPLAQLGMGSQRLTSIGLNIAAFQGNNVLLIDEIETGLEPYRIKNIIKLFRSSENTSQVIMTTHSPAVIINCNIEEILVVRSENGITTGIVLHDDDKDANNEIQKQLRKNPEAFLSRKILVAEGRTEMGLLRSMDRHSINADYDFAYNGVEIADGVGNNFSKCADVFRKCGYNVGVFLDADDSNANKQKEKLVDSGINVFDWGDGNAIEDQIFLDVPLAMMNDLIKVAVECCGFNKVREDLERYGFCILTDDDKETIDVKDDSAKNRKIIGSAAKNGEWFKRMDWGEKMGDVIFAGLDSINEDTMLYKVLLSVKTWIKSDGQE